MNSFRWARQRSLPMGVLLLTGLLLTAAPVGFTLIRTAAAEEAAGVEEAAESAPPGEIRFVGKNRVATANSVFHRWKVTKAEIDPENIGAGEVVIEIDVASLDTGIPRRDDHLRTPDFFDVETWPTATVRLYNAKPAEGEGARSGLYTAKMDLTIRDIQKTRDVEFELLDPQTFHVRGAFTILRTDFGVGEPYKRLNPLSVQDEVKLSFEATLLGGA